jgi:hypothetical protein
MEESVPKRLKRAHIWDFFEAQNDGLAQCKVCRKEVSRKAGQTSTMRRHLSSLHIEKYSELLKSESVVKKKSPKVQLKLPFMNKEKEGSLSLTTAKKVR